MIVLDSNVLSELMRPVPCREVLNWVDAHDPASLLITAITMAEILYGIARLPEGDRKSALLDTAMAMFEEDFAERILAFEEHAAAHYAELVTQREQAGRPISMADARIAAICLSHETALATRNSKDFADLGLPLIDPWSAGKGTASPPST
ncbi:MAG: type II toxin-antitoxin system VapC family toxin [Nitrococcus mobilis]|nr:type II toxin-antitoxin system VapC family toxin [Nitrococcus mobilis]